MTQTDCSSTESQSGGSDTDRLHCWKRSEKLSVQREALFDEEITLVRLASGTELHRPCFQVLAYCIRHVSRVEVGSSLRCRFSARTRDCVRSCSSWLPLRMSELAFSYSKPEEGGGGGIVWRMSKRGNAKHVTNHWRRSNARRQIGSLASRVTMTMRDGGLALFPR